MRFSLTRLCRAAVACLAVVLVVAGCAAAPLQPGGALLLPATYRLVWADEFSVDGLPDPAKWDHDIGRNKAGWYNNELQYYSGPRAENAVVRGGRLLLTARKEALSGAADWGGQRFTSSRLVTRGRADWTYGFFEVRAKMPCGRGTWPAIWLVGSGGRWPDDGELDMVEHVGNNPQRVSSAVHTRAASGGTAVSGKAWLPDACQAMHDYQMLWTPQAVWFGIDGVVHWHYPRPAARPEAWPFDQPQFMILNIAVGGDLGGSVAEGDFPVTMEVEHVRVYQAERPGARR